VASSVVPGLGLLGKVAPYLWQEQGTDLWPVIRENVEAVVKAKIDDAAYKNVRIALKIIENELKKYSSNPTALEAAAQLTNLESMCDGLMTVISELPRPEQSLPYIAMAGSLHIVILQERWRRAAELYKESPEVVATRAKTIADTITKHQKLIDERKSAALQWRRSLVGQYTNFDFNSYVRDDFFGMGPTSASMGPRLVPNDPFLPKYTDFVVRMFEEQLNAFLLPSRLWKYLNPDNNEIPVRTIEMFSTGPHGWVDAETFIYQTNSEPLDLLNLSTGYWVDSLWVRYQRDRDAGGNFYGKHRYDPNRELKLRPEEKVVQVWGGMRGFHELGLNFKTNQGRILGGGVGENRWKSEPPANAQAFLAGISGHYDDERLFCVYLHWKYRAWA
jgi:hypothetical protein